MPYAIIDQIYFLVSTGEALFYIETAILSTLRLSKPELKIFHSKEIFCDAIFLQLVKIEQVLRSNQAEVDARKAALSGAQMVETESDELTKFLIVDQICEYATAVLTGWPDS